MPIRYMVLKIYLPCKYLYLPRKYLYKPCKADVYCLENKQVPRPKNHLPLGAQDHKSLHALGQNPLALGIQAHVDVEPWCVLIIMSADIPVIQQTWVAGAGLILGLHPANERRRYFVTMSLIGWVQA